MEFKEIVKILEECEELNGFCGSEDQRNNKQIFLEKLKEAFDESTGTIRMIKNRPVIEIEMRHFMGTEIEFGVNRDMFHDADWDELRSTNLGSNETKSIKLDNKEIKLLVLEDLAYAYGRNTKKFSKKVEEFKILG